MRPSGRFGPHVSVRHDHPTVRTFDDGHACAEVQRQVLGGHHLAGVAGVHDPAVPEQHEPVGVLPGQA